MSLQWTAIQNLFSNHTGMIDEMTYDLSKTYKVDPISVDIVKAHLVDLEIITVSYNITYNLQKNYNGRP